MEPVERRAGRGSLCPQRKRDSQGGVQIPETSARHKTSYGVNTEGAQDAPCMTPRARINPCGETVLEFPENPNADLHRLRYQSPHCASPCSQRPQRSHVFISGLSPALWPSLSETGHGGKGSEWRVPLTVQTVLPGFLLTTLQSWLVCPSGEPAVCSGVR